MGVRNIHINYKNKKIPLLMPEKCSVNRFKRILSNMKIFNCEPDRILISNNGKIICKDDNIDFYDYLEIHTP
jgi:hypothetical protein